MLFLSTTMINNINNFGTINFYENNNSNSKKDQAQTVEDVTPVEEPEPKPSKSPKDILEIPREGKYTEVRRYIKERILFDEEFKRFYEDSTRVELCARLTKEFGWFVDPNSLGKNLNRKR